jgi:hypothetical protein
MAKPAPALDPVEKIVEEIKALPLPMCAVCNKRVVGIRVAYSPVTLVLSVLAVCHGSRERVELGHMDLIGVRSIVFVGVAFLDDLLKYSIEPFTLPAHKP